MAWLSQFDLKRGYPYQVDLLFEIGLASGRQRATRTSLLKEIQEALLKKDFDSDSLRRLIRIKREVVRLNPEVFPEVRELRQVLKDIPSGMSCACCGYANLVNWKVKNGKIVGPECASLDHPFGSCRSGSSQGGRGVGRR